MGKLRIILLISIYVILTSCSGNQLSLKQKITTNQKYNYALYMDTWGIGDQGYYVLQLEKDIKPEDVYVEINMEGINKKQKEWVNKRTILFNYSEAGYHHKNPNIKLINNRFLVFSRGGYYYGLYDIKTQKAISNTTSPWNAFIDKSGYKSEKYDRKKEEKAYTEWIKKIINDEIKEYIKSNE